MELWAELCQKFCCLYSGLVDFQSFLLSVSQEEFSNWHLEINSTKNMIVDRVVDLFMVTIDDYLIGYVR